LRVISYIVTFFSDYDDFNSQPVYDVADVLKLYFHELPECLLTEKLSETCISIFTRKYCAFKSELIGVQIPVR
jgi:RhoGAP domain